MKLSKKEWIAVVVSLFALLFVFGFDPSATAAPVEVPETATETPENGGN